MTGLAETEELEQVKQFENQLLKRELTQGEALGNLTAHGSVLTSELKNISAAININIQTESEINKKIAQVINTQVLGEKEVNKLISILDLNIKKGNRMTSLLTELIFLEKMVSKFQKYVNNAANNIFDIFNVDTRALAHHFGSHGMESLKFTEAEVLWGDEGFEIRYNLRRLSEGYKIFNLKSMIISTNNESTTLGTKLNIENSIAISSTGEYVLG